MMGPLLLLLTTFIWGTAFLAQKYGADSFGPFALTSFRNFLGGGFLLTLIALRRRRGGFAARRSAVAGVWCGLPLFAAMLAQQIGIEHTTPGISAFLTTNYVIFVPLATIVLTRRLPRAAVWAGMALAIVGTWLICMNGEAMSLGRGEAWTILCAALFSVQMLAVDHFAPTCDVLVMSAAQLVTAAVCSLPFVLLPSECARLAECSFSLASLWPLVYLGVFSSGIAYTLQNYGQARTPPALAAIILSMESVFGALSGYVVRGDVMTVAQFVGCSLVFSAVVVSQLPAKGR